MRLTLPETNIAPKNGGFPIRTSFYPGVYFQMRSVSFQGGYDGIFTQMCQVGIDSS